MSRAEIRIDANGFGKVVLDGYDVSDAVHGVEIRTWAGRPPAVSLDIVEDVRVTAEAEVTIRPAVRALLIRLGWTPPTDHTSALASGQGLSAESAASQ